jgi:hypothetical protein
MPIENYRIEISNLFKIQKKPFQIIRRVLFETVARDFDKKLNLSVLLCRSPLSTNSICLRWKVVQPL